MRRSFAPLFTFFVTVGLVMAAGAAVADVTQYVRYQHGGAVGFGIVDGATVRASWSM